LWPALSPEVSRLSPERSIQQLQSSVVLKYCRLEERNDNVAIFKIFVFGFIILNSNSASQSCSCTSIVRVTRARLYCYYTIYYSIIYYSVFLFVGSADLSVLFEPTCIVNNECINMIWSYNIIFIIFATRALIAMTMILLYNMYYHFGFNDGRRVFPQYLYYYVVYSVVHHWHIGRSSCWTRAHTALHLRRFRTEERAARNTLIYK